MNDYSLLEAALIADKNAKYDAEALSILAQKTLMAGLLKEVVPEVKPYSIEEIETFIEGTPKLKEYGVHPNTKTFLLK